MSKKKTLVIIAVFLLCISSLSLLESDAQTNDVSEPATTTIDFSSDPDTAIQTLNNYKTGSVSSVWTSGTNTLDLNGIDLESTAINAIKFPDNSTINVNADSSIKAIAPSTGKDGITVITANGGTISGNGTLSITMKDERGGHNGDTCLDRVAKISCDLVLSGSEIVSVLNTTGISSTSATSISDCKISIAGLDKGIVTGKLTFLRCNVSIETSHEGINVMASAALSVSDSPLFHVYAVNNYALLGSGTCYVQNSNLDLKGGLSSFAGFSSYSLPSHESIKGSKDTTVEPSTNLPDYEDWQTVPEYKWIKAIWKDKMSTTLNFNSNPDSSIKLLNIFRTGDVKSTWDSANKILTLNGIYVETKASSCIVLPAGSKLVLNGENIFSSYANDNFDAILVSGSDGVIEGGQDGKLAININGNAHSIYLFNGIKTFADCEIDITLPDEKDRKAYIYVPESGDNMMINCTFNLQNCVVSSDNNNLTIEKCHFTMYGSVGGITAISNAVIKDSEINVSLEGGDTSVFGGKITLVNSKFDAYAEKLLEYGADYSIDLCKDLKAYDADGNIVDFNVEDIESYSGFVCVWEEDPFSEPPTYEKTPLAYVIAVLLLIFIAAGVYIVAKK